VDKRFRVHGPEGEAMIYGSVRSSIERVNSRPEGQVCLDRHRVRGLSARNEELPLKPKCARAACPLAILVCMRPASRLRRTGARDLGFESGYVDLSLEKRM
jgi:hypothetical protein